MCIRDRVSTQSTWGSKARTRATEFSLDNEDEDYDGAFLGKGHETSEGLYLSALKNTNEVSQFMQLIQSMQNANPTLYNLLSSRLSAETMGELQALIKDVSISEVP
eukprot:TRINITY_DN10519_c0_g2_i2.p1 TRINITY_DN10519_c0_g2~~TRINITY_DN10519_c0_g2_i2.p1  ORF type:complete len:106 (+),score=12.64 TRINITY_DN10519_c0_g2_i2:65-382(+)